jgi:hypothetical protein
VNKDLKNERVLNIDQFVGIVVKNYTHTNIRVRGKVLKKIVENLIVNLVDLFPKICVN